MRALRVWLLRLLGIFGKARRDRELSEEIESHLELHIADNMRAGMAPREARRAALLKFGPVESIKESYRDRRGVPLLESLIGDLRLGVRMLRKRPGFTLIGTLTLALGIAGTTTIFSVIDPLLLRSLPYPEAERLAEVHRVWPNGRVYPSLDTGVWERLRDRLLPDVFERVEASVPYTRVMTGAAEPQEVRAQAFTPGVLPLLGARPLAGRLFTESDATPGATPVVVLGERLWRRAFGADPGLLGGAIELEGIALTVIGIMPDTFKYPLGIVDMWMPLRLDDPIFPVRGYEALVRLREGVSPRAAQERIDALATLFADEHPRPETGRLLSVEPLDRSLLSGMEDSLALLAGAVACILLIACVNVANLMLVRASARQPELALRRSLGATSRRLVRQMITESLVLALLGGLLGVLLGHAGVRLLLGMLPDALVRYTQVTIGVDMRVLVFSLLVTVATGVACGAFPAIRAARRTTLADAGERTMTASASANRAGAALVVVQIALSMTLLVGAGLLARSFTRLLAVDPGFRPHGLLVLQINLASYRYPDDTSTELFYGELKERLLAVPGVNGVAISDGIPPRPSGWTSPSTLQLDSGEQRAMGGLRLPHAVVDADYFEVLGVPIVAGRGFSREDTPSSPVSVVIDPDLAALLWPDGSAVGERFRIDPEEPWLNVVGVTGDVRLMGPDDRQAPYGLYYAASQQTPWRYRAVAIRTSGDAGGRVRDVRETVRTLDPSQPILDIVPAADLFARSVQRQRFVLVLMSVFTVVAVVLAAVGVYGMTSYVVAQRTREVGVRMAMGAAPGSVIGRILRGGVLLAGLGVTIGAIAALMLSRFLASLLFEVEPTDPATFATVALLLVAVAVASALVPALRAGRTSPIDALRTD